MVGVVKRHIYFPYNSKQKENPFLRKKREYKVFTRSQNVRNNNKNYPNISHFSLYACWFTFKKLIFFFTYTSTRNKTQKIMLLNVEFTLLQHFISFFLLHCLGSLLQTQTDEFLPIISPLLECTTRPSYSTIEFFMEPHGVFSGSFSSLWKMIIKLWRLTLWQCLVMMNLLGMDGMFWSQNRMR